MIRYLEQGDGGRLLSLCNHDPINGANAATAWKVYGPGSRLADFWLCDDVALYRMGETLTVVGEQSSCADELAEFVPFSGCSIVEGNAGAVGFLPGTKLEEQWVMRCDSVLPSKGEGIVENPPLGAVYRLLGQEEEMSRWEDWYPHHSHLVRHGLGVVAGIFREGEQIATGGIYATSKAYGVLANMLTHPDHRGQGLAGEIAAFLCRWCRDRQLTPALLCGEERKEFYEALGFRHCGSWCRIAVGHP